MSKHFDSLPWFLKEYIHENRWGSFRRIQEEAFGTFCESDDHILISAGTSSGKTEAALFPVISSLYRIPCKGIGALYIGPLKALIDDQFERLSTVLGQSGIRVTGWHGDISQSVKRKVLDDPSGILQITPESLQNIVINDYDELPRLFGNLRFVIIDEVHSFISSARGLQLLCSLSQLEKVSGCSPMRIGLSATVSDPEEAGRWLASGTGRDVRIIYDGLSRDKEVRLTYDIVPESGAESSDERKKAISTFYKRLYSETKGKNCIIFVNSRTDSEVFARSLKKVYSKLGNKEPIHVHHGSISKDFRKMAEDDLKDPRSNSKTVATSTLELGIDVGNLDRIIQIDPPFTCSSLIQRMGRSGRRGGKQQLTLMVLNNQDMPYSMIEDVDMRFLKALSICDLVIRESWTEPLVQERFPYGILFHQTLQYLKKGLGAKLNELCKEVLSLPPFHEIDRSRYVVLLNHMLRTDILMKMEDGTILIGKRGETMAFNRDFCSVFEVQKEVEVRCEGKTVGTIQNMPEENVTIQLAGHVWLVTAIHPEEFYIDVIESDGSTANRWRSSTPDMDTRVLENMRDILADGREFSFIDDKAREMLETYRSIAASSGMLETVTETDTGLRLHPWLGTVQFETLRRIIDIMPETKSTYCCPPYFIEIRTDLSAENFMEELRARKKRTDPFNLVSPGDRIGYGKYDRFLPEELLIEKFVMNRIDMDFDI